MYYVNYVTRNGNHNVERSFETQREAISFYKENLRLMAYGYISDDDAREVAEEVKQNFEEELEERARQEEETYYNDDWLARFVR